MSVTYNVLSGSYLLGQLAALHGAEVQVLVEEFSIQDVPHRVLQAASVAVEHPGRMGDNDVTSSVINSHG